MIDNQQHKLFVAVADVRVNYKGAWYEQLVKIGYSRNPWERIKVVKEEYNHRYDFRLVLVTPGWFREKSKLCQKFRPLNIHADLFVMDNKFKAYIEEFNKSSQSKQKRII